MKEHIRPASAIIVALTIVGCTSVKHPASAESQDPGKALFDRGSEALAAQRYGEGIVLLDTLVASYPKSSYADPGRQALQNCIQLTACATARAAVSRGGGMTFFPNKPIPSPQPGSTKN